MDFVRKLPIRSESPEVRWERRFWISNVKTWVEVAVVTGEIPSFVRKVKIRSFMLDGYETNDGAEWSRQGKRRGGPRGTGSEYLHPMLDEWSGHD